MPRRNWKLIGIRFNNNSYKILVCNETSFQCSQPYVESSLKILDWILTGTSTRISGVSASESPVETTLVTHLYLY